MLDPIRQTVLYDQNAIYYRYPIEYLMENAGKGIARALVRRYGKNKRIGFFCGLGNNGGDGFAAARYVRRLKAAEPEVYLIPSASKIRTEESHKNWKRFTGTKFENVRAKDIPNHFDVVVECLFGTGITGAVREPYESVIAKLNRLKGRKVTIDIPAPGFKMQRSISMMFPKVRGATVIDIGYPRWLAERIGVGEVKVLAKPALTSHKGDNGKLLIIGGGKRYHGALTLASAVAGKIVDLVYASSVPENATLIRRMKSKLAEFIAVPRDDLAVAVRSVDAVLIGPGLGANRKTRELVNQLVKRFRTKTFVLDADALRVMDKKLLNKHHIVTPHRAEFRKLFGVAPTKENLRKVAKKHKCVIVLKGKVDYVSYASRDRRGRPPFPVVRENLTGNAGMTKGGTGDVLAGLIAALACTNELWLAASAGSFVNGLAGDRLKERLSYYYSASDLVREIPKTLTWCERF